MVTETQAVEPMVKPVAPPQPPPQQLQERNSKRVDGSQIANLVSMVFYRDDRSRNVNEGRVIAITSPIHGEGVTTISQLIAQQLTRTDLDSTLLVSTKELETLEPEDLRNVDDLWMQNKADGLWIRKPNGKQVAPGATPWSTDVSFRRTVLSLIRTRFRNVILDCRPVRNTSDMALMAALTDGIVVVVRSGGSTRDELQDALRILQITSGDVKGFCFNRRTYPIPTRIYKMLYGR